MSTVLSNGEAKRNWMKPIDGRWALCASSRGMARICGCITDQIRDPSV